MKCSLKRRRQMQHMLSAGQRTDITDLTSSFPPSSGVLQHHVMQCQKEWIYAFEQRKSCALKKVFFWEGHSHRAVAPMANSWEQIDSLGFWDHTLYRSWKRSGTQHSLAFQELLKVLFCVYCGAFWDILLLWPASAFSVGNARGNWCITLERWLVLLKFLLHINEKGYACLYL